MPHQIIEYSKNLEQHLEIDELLRALHEAAAGLEFLPTAGIRTRAVGRDRVRIADGHEDNAFIHVTFRIAAGRSEEQKQLAGETLFTALCRFVEDYYQQAPLAMSLEVLELDPAFRWKKGNIREFIARRNN